MKSLCLVLILAVSIPGCSMFKKRTEDRAYNKYLMKMQNARQRQRSQAIQQRNDLPTVRPTPTEPILKTSVSE